MIDVALGIFGLVVFGLIASLFFDPMDEMKRIERRKRWGRR
jgi:hypothetical protein